MINIALVYTNIIDRILIKKDFPPRDIQKSFLGVSQSFMIYLFGDDHISIGEKLLSFFSGLSFGLSRLTDSQNLVVSCGMEDFIRLV